METRGAVTIGEETVLDLGAWGQHVNVLSCPGCDHWQLDYTNAVAMQWYRQGWRETPEGLKEPYVDTRDWDDFLEFLLREHVGFECPHPGIIQAMLADRGWVLEPGGKWSKR